QTEEGVAIQWLEPPDPMQPYVMVVRTDGELSPYVRGYLSMDKNVDQRKPRACVRLSPEPRQPVYRIYWAREMAVTLVVLYGRWPAVQQVMLFVNERAKALSVGGFGVHCLGKPGLISPLGAEQALVIRDWTEHGFRSALRK
ncbi:hypothetical protein CYMTET_42837, partial [Cymbomonas tetramitiformis]